MTHPLQAMMDKMNEMDSATRSGYHLTLGELDYALKDAEPNLPVVFDDGQGAGKIDSYRGYYTDLAIGDGPAKLVSVWRDVVAEALLSTFEGYKGGDNPASPDKPLWRSEYGTASGVGIMGAETRNGAFVLLTKQVD